MKPMPAPVPSIAMMNPMVRPMVWMSSVPGAQLIPSFSLGKVEAVNAVPQGTSSLERLEVTLLSPVTSATSVQPLAKLADTCRGEAVAVRHRRRAPASLGRDEQKRPS